MRDIKFRAWLRGKMYVLAFPWYGDECLVPSPKGYIITKDATLMQYTGLKDKNGKEIYEGDIVERGITISKVVYSAPSFYLNPPSEQISDVNKPIEVIGNIYENPELLK